MAKLFNTLKATAKIPEELSSTGGSKGKNPVASGVNFNTFLNAAQAKTDEASARQPNQAVVSQAANQAVAPVVTVLTAEVANHPEVVTAETAALRQMLVEAAKSENSPAGQGWEAAERSEEAAPVSESDRTAQAEQQLVMLGPEFLPNQPVVEILRVDLVGLTTEVPVAANPAFSGPTASEKRSDVNRAETLSGLAGSEDGVNRRADPGLAGLAVKLNATLGSGRPEAGGPATAQSVEQTITLNAEGVEDTLQRLDRARAINAGVESLHPKLPAEKTGLTNPVLVGAQLFETLNLPKSGKRTADSLPMSATAGQTLTVVPETTPGTPSLLSGNSLIAGLSSEITESPSPWHAAGLTKPEASVNPPGFNQILASISAGTLEEGAVAADAGVKLEGVGETGVLDLAALQTGHAIQAAADALGAQVTVAPQPLNEVAPVVTHTPDGTAAPSADQHDLFSQIIAGGKIMVNDGRSEMELSLQPEHLGKLKLKIALEHQIVTASFTAESEQVKQIIETNLVNLRKLLQDNGIQVEQLQVAVGQHQNEAGTSHHSQQQQRRGEPRQLFDGAATGEPAKERGWERVQSSARVDLIA